MLFIIPKAILLIKSKNYQEIQREEQYTSQLNTSPLSNISYSSFFFLVVLFKASKSVKPSQSRSTAFTWLLKYLLELFSF